MRAQVANTRSWGSCMVVSATTPSGLPTPLLFLYRERRLASMQETRYVALRRRTLTSRQWSTWFSSRWQASAQGRQSFSVDGITRKVPLRDAHSLQSSRIRLLALWHRRQHAAQQPEVYRSVSCCRGKCHAVDVAGLRSHLQIDPNRTVSAGKVEIGAFRTYPEVSTTRHLRVLTSRATLLHQLAALNINRFLLRRSRISVPMPTLTILSRWKSTSLRQTSSSSTFSGTNTGSLLSVRAQYFRWVHLLAARADIRTAPI